MESVLLAYIYSSYLYLSIKLILMYRDFVSILLQKRETAPGPFQSAFRNVDKSRMLASVRYQNDLRQKFLSVSYLEQIRAIL